MTGPTRIAACHVAPVFLSAKETTAKAIELIGEAAGNNANLIVFPESYIPAFPIWSALRPPSENHELFKRMVAESVYVDGDEIGAIRAAAKQLGVLVSMGFSEKARYSSATLWNSNVLVGADGEILVHHRKLVPTFYEKLTWAPGDGHGLKVADTPFGRVGVLICGENTNPLARYALAAQGEQIHISSWPPIWPTRMPREALSATGGEAAASNGTGDGKGAAALSSVARGANYDNVAANRTRAAAHCFEAKCFGVLCASRLDAAAVEGASAGSGTPDAVKRGLQHASRGATMFLDTTGALLPGFTVVDGAAKAHERRDMLKEDEVGILYVDVDLDDCVEGKQYHDIAGGYQRLDVFELKVDRTRREPVSFR
ncbi:carbon-nitrogen hydrolase [Hypoxylon rubiginosum]|uniref:Carbon-nitrogen hydrolase n=1 Tax=Hypoxylon rubiginosum TaxID=110542 RepID=A0ACB9YWN7_9PEZI|nr:carbon-nitrogen hydrolase [Hypoxylon rubiginosum]